MIRLVVSTPVGEFFGKPAEHTEEYKKELTNLIIQLADRGTYLKFEADRGTVFIMKETLTNSVIFMEELGNS